MKRHRHQYGNRHLVPPSRKPPVAAEPAPRSEPPPPRVRHKVFGEGDVLQPTGGLARLNHRVLFDDGQERVIRSEYLEVLEA